MEINTWIFVFIIYSLTATGNTQATEPIPDPLLGSEPRPDPGTSSRPRTTPVPDPGPKNTGTPIALPNVQTTLATRPTRPPTRPTRPPTRPTRPPTRPTRPPTHPTRPSTRPTRQPMRPTRPTPPPTIPASRPPRPRPSFPPSVPTGLDTVTSEFWGDPHCEMFSGKKFLIRGSCHRTLVTNACRIGATATFSIVGKFMRWKPSWDRTFVEEVKITMVNRDGHTVVVDLEQGNNLVLTNEDVPTTLTVTSFPFEDNPAFPGVSISRSTDPEEDLGPNWKDSFTVDTIKFGNRVMIRWDGLKHLQITMPVGSPVCGIAGTPGSNDLIIGPHDVSHADDNSGCPGLAAQHRQGMRTRDEKEYVDSWFAGVAETDEDCIEACFP